MPTSAQAPAVPRLTYLRIKNYRALRDVEFRDLTPLTVLIGPNGSGKSTVFDALDFLAEAVGGDLKGAWKKRNKFAGMRTQGSNGVISFELSFQTSLVSEPLDYLLELGEWRDECFVRKEKISIRRSESKQENVLFNAENKEGARVALVHIMQEEPLLKKGDSSTVNLDPMPAVFSLKRGPYVEFVSSFENKIQDYAREIVIFLASYRLLHLTDDHLKGYSDAGPQEQLSPNGDNLPNVLYYLHLRHPAVLARLTAKLKAWVPGLADVIPEITSDERLLLRFKDAPFEKPLPAQYMSGGTMRLAALFALLYEPDATGLLGIEEPENELHPQLLYRLAEELLKASETRQLLVATHSPFLLDALAPEQVWILHRGADGYTQATRTADIPNVKGLVEDGSPLGYLWNSNFFPVGDPLGPRSTPADAR